MGIAELIRGDNGRADGAEGVHRLAEQPLTAIPLELPVARAHIMSHRVARDILHGVRRGHPMGGLADDDDHFHFKV